MSVVDSGSQVLHEETVVGLCELESERFGLTEADYRSLGFLELVL